MNIKTQFVLSVILTAIVATFVYITFHELGHTLVAIACGARITEVSIFNAHMRYEGGNFTNVTKSLLHAGGMLFPLLIAAISMCFYKRNAKSMIYHIAYLCFTFISTCSTLAWIIVPIVTLFSQPPAGDDVTKFMLTSGWFPLFIAIGAFLVILLMIIWMFFKGMPLAFVQIIKKVQHS